MRIYLMLFLTALITGCSKGDAPQPPTNMTPTETNIEETCEKFGIAPKDIGSITSINLMIDSLSYKLAGGAKGSNSWFAKFSPSGNELYSYSLNPCIANKESAYVNTKSFLWVYNSNEIYIDENKLFLITWFQNENKTSEDDYNSVLSILDFTKGGELARLPFEPSTDKYNIFKNNDFYYILSGRGVYKRIYCINPKGSLEWHREVTEAESSDGLSAYADFQALNNELILFFSSKVVGNFSEKTIKVIDLKNYLLKLELLCHDIPFIGDKYNEKNISYRFNRAEQKDDIINVYFDEYSAKNVIDDEITGSSHIEYTLEGKYFYSVQYPTGEIIGKYKI